MTIEMYSVHEIINQIKFNKLPWAILFFDRVVIVLCFRSFTFVRSPKGDIVKKKRKNKNKQNKKKKHFSSANLFKWLNNPFKRLNNPFKRINNSFKRINNPFKRINYPFKRINISFTRINIRMLASCKNWKKRGGTEWQNVQSRRIRFARAVTSLSLFSFSLPLILFKDRRPSNSCWRSG